MKVSSIAAFATVACVQIGVSQAQTSSPPPMSDFFKTCLATGGGPAIVGDYPNIQVMRIVNASGIAGAANSSRFIITAAPAANVDTNVVIERLPAPSGEDARFSLRQGQSQVVDVLAAKVINTYGGKMEICIRKL